MVRDVEVQVPLEELIDVGAERRRLEKEIDKLARLLKGLDSKLNQSAFLEKAPGEVVAPGATEAGGVPGKPFQTGGQPGSSRFLTENPQPGAIRT